MKSLFVSPCPPDRTDITKDSQSMEKISLFLLPTVRFSRPTRFCFIYYYIHPIRHLLTYSLTYRYLLTCAIVCVLVFVCLAFFFVFEVIWAGFAILSCGSKSVWLSYRELEMLWSVNFRSSMTLISYPDLTLFYTPWPWEIWVRD